MGKSYAIHGVLLCCGLFLGCGDTKRVPPTQIVVAVTSDLTAATELSRITLKVSKPDGGAATADADYAVVSGSHKKGQVVLPITFSVIKGQENSFMLVVTGYGPLGSGGAEEKIIEQKAIATFQERKTLLLKTFLGRVCLKQFCKDDLVCYPSSVGKVKAGECGAAADQSGNALTAVNVDDLPDLDLSKPPAGVAVSNGGSGGAAGSGGTGGASVVTVNGGSGGAAGTVGSGGTGGGGGVSGTAGRGGAAGTGGATVNSGSGGAAGTAGTGGVGGGGVGGGGIGGGGGCNAPTPCGGTLDGTWQIDTNCVEGNLAPLLSQASGLPSSCSDVYQSVALTQTGTVTFAGGTETENITNTYHMVLLYTSACETALNGATVTIDAVVCSARQQLLTTSGQGVSNPTATCSFTGGNCVCLVYSQSQVTSTPKAYTVSGTRATFTDGSPPLDYCISGSTLTVRQASQDVAFTFTTHKL